MVYNYLGTPVEMEERTHIETFLAPRYIVFLHNDPITHAHFVIEILTKIFYKARVDAIDIMMRAHIAGVAMVDVLPLEQAEFRADQAHSRARTNGFPLTFSIEKE